MFQNRSSSTESAHTNTGASFRGHCLDSNGKRKKCVSRRKEFFKSEKEWDLESFCGIGIILRLKHNLEVSKKLLVELNLDLDYFCPKKKGKRTGLRKFLSKKAKERKGVRVKILCSSKKENVCKVKQIRRGVRSPVR